MKKNPYLVFIPGLSVGLQPPVRRRSERGPDLQLRQRPPAAQAHPGPQGRPGLCGQVRGSGGLFPVEEAEDGQDQSADKAV